MPTIAPADDGNEDGTSLEAPDDVEDGLLRSGEEGPLTVGGAEDLRRRLEIEPSIVDALINCECSRLVGNAISERIEKVEPPRGRCVGKVGLLGCVGTSSASVLCPLTISNCRGDGSGGSG